MTDKLLKVKDVIELLAIGESTWWAGVASNKFPQGVWLGPRTRRWHLSEVELVMNGQWKGCQ